MSRITSLIIINLLVSISTYAQTIVKIHKENGVYQIPCKVNGLSLDFIFDTGASDVTISMSEALFMIKNNYLSEEDITGTEYYSIANGSIEEGTSINLKVIEISGLKLYNVKASIVHSLEAPLLLGQSALQKLGRIEFDYDSEKLIIYKHDDSILVNKRSIEGAISTENDSTYDTMAVLFYDKGIAEGQMGNIKKSIEYFTKAIEIENDYVIAYLNRGIANLNLIKKINPLKSHSDTYDSRYEDEFNLLYKHCHAVIEDANKVISIQPNDFRGYYLKGKAKFKLKDYLGAVSEFDQAILFDLDNRMMDESYFNRAQSYYELNKYIKTVKDCNSSIRISPSGEAYLLRAKVIERLIGTRFAMNDFSKAGELGSKEAYKEIEERRWKYDYPYTSIINSAVGIICSRLIVLVVIVLLTVITIKKIKKRNRAKYNK